MYTPWKTIEKSQRSAGRVPQCGCCHDFETAVADGQAPSEVPMAMGRLSIAWWPPHDVPVAMRPCPAEYERKQLSRGPSQNV